MAPRGARLPGHLPYKMVYDVWGRLRMIKNQSSNLVEEYRYNGLNQRLSWHYDTDADGDCDSNDKTYYFAYDDQWRVVATFRDSDTSPKERFLYHAAGLGGYGGAGGGIGGYIDHVIFRDKDANTAWDTASDGTLEERIYYCQNWRADVSAILTSSGKLVEWIKYSAYGTPTALPTGDTDSDGDFDINDLGNMGGGYELRKDAELDGDVDGNDVNYAIANGYQTLERGVLSSSYVANRKGYAGYENDGAIVRFAHVRNRVLDSTLGRWTRRDPLGYVDGMGLYGYVGAQIIGKHDSSGLSSSADPCASELLNYESANSAWYETQTACGRCVFVEDPADKAACLLQCAQAQSSVRAWIQSACISLQKCQRQHNQPVTECDNGGNIAPNPSTIPSSFPDFPNPARPDGVRPLWPTTCVSQTNNFRLCADCCFQNHAAEVIACYKTYQGHGSTMWRLRRNKWNRELNECVRNSTVRYATCVALCQTVYPPGPGSVPGRVPEPAPIPGLEERWIGSGNGGGEW